MMAWMRKVKARHAPRKLPQLNINHARSIARNGTQPRRWPVTRPWTYSTADVTQNSDVLIAKARRARSCLANRLINPWAFFLSSIKIRVQVRWQGVTVAGCFTNS